MSWGSQALGMIGGFMGADSQHRRQRDLMGLQNRYQQGLNQQGHDLQYAMWNKTNYGAQVKHMLEAGLNPALMYGSAGQGGTTGSQGGGSAAGGSAAAYNVMDLSNAKLEAEIDAIKEGVEYSKWQRGDKGQAEIEEINARIRNLNEEEKRIIAQASKHVSEKEKIDIEKEILNIDKNFFKENDLAPGDFGIIKGLKATGFDLWEIVKWMLDIDEKEVNEILELPGDIKNNSSWRNKNN